MPCIVIVSQRPGYITHHMRNNHNSTTSGQSSGESGATAPNAETNIDNLIKDYFRIGGASDAAETIDFLLGNFMASTIDQEGWDQLFIVNTVSHATGITTFLVKLNELMMLKGGSHD